MPDPEELARIEIDALHAPYGWMVQDIPPPRAAKQLDPLDVGSRAAQAGFNKGNLERFEFVLPPLVEQRRIAEVLDRAEALRARRRATLAQLNFLTQSLFLDLFGDPAANPKVWLVRTIAELCEVKGGKRLPKGEKYSLTPTQFRYIRVTDLTRLGGEISVF